MSEITRETVLREVLNVITDMRQAYKDAGRTVSLGEVEKWLKYELGIGEGRNG